MSQEYIIDVDENWIDKDGNDYRLFTADEPVDKGYMLNTPQRVRLPNGDIEIGNRIEITPKGLDWLNEILPDDIRDDALSEAETLCPSTTIQ